MVLVCISAHVSNVEFSQVVLYHDPAARNVHISEDEGKSWKLVSGIPEREAAVFVEHPFDNRMVNFASPLLDFSARRVLTSDGPDLVCPMNRHSL